VMLVERVLPIAIQRLNTIQAGALLTDAAKLLCDTHKALLVVCNPDGVMVGIISKTDIVRQVAHCEGSRCTTPAEAVMTRDVIYCHPSDPMHDVLSKMKERGFVHVPIVDQESKPIGVINARDASRSSWEMSSTTYRSFAIMSQASGTADRGRRLCHQVEG
jgi:CBS domain-containing protein